MSKYAGEVEAYRAASELASRLSDAFGVDWRVRVWENLGWYMSVSYGYLKVHEGYDGQYYTLLGDHGGLVTWTPEGHFDSPAEAVEVQLKTAWEVVDRMISLIPGLTVVEGYSREEKSASRTGLEDDCGTVAVSVRVPASLSHTGYPRKTLKAIDTCIADIVAAMISAGIYTSGSCCGHGEIPGSIVLTDGRCLEVTFPDDWKAHRCQAGQEQRLVTWKA